ncbi:MAG: methionyl-tRNA formyltransferase [Verrucomicrobiae bacterium]|nr:methionyl-tRNA formyltransferase [Verrucomicrobiae bacterium]
MKVVFIGTGEIGVPCLNSLAESDEYEVVAVVTQPDRPAGRQMRLQTSPIKQAALKWHIRIYQPQKINEKTVVAQLRYLEADVFVVVAYGQILSQAILNLPKLGCLNVHASLLPKYRGASPIQAAIRAGERYSGITIMWMDEGLDTGDILCSQRLSIRSDETAETLHDRLAELAPKTLKEGLDLLQKGKAPRMKQKEKEAIYAKKIKKEEGWIDWKQEQVAVDRQIRAMIPWPGAYTWLKVGNQRKCLKIFKTILSNRCHGKPGEVVKVDKHGILVAAKKGGLLLREVQLEGKQRMAATDFVRGFSIPIGTILESP